MLEEEICPICQKCMGVGKALFTSGCEHTFHYMCVQETYLSGSKPCPTCGAQFAEPPVLLTDRTITADWYFGAINRDQAEMLLMHANEEGTFLVRDSAQNNGQYCVSFLNDKVRHCRVFLNERGAYFLTTNRHSFKTIGDLVEYYRSSYLTHAVGENGIEPALFKFTKPCPKELKSLLSQNNSEVHPNQSQPQRQRQWQRPSNFPTHALPSPRNGNNSLLATSASGSSTGAGIGVPLNVYAVQDDASDGFNSRPNNSNSGNVGGRDSGNGSDLVARNNPSSTARGDWYINARPSQTLDLPLDLANGDDQYVNSRIPQATPLTSSSSGSSPTIPMQRPYSYSTLVRDS